MSSGPHDAMLVSDQVFLYMRDEIAGGNWPPGKRIPSEMKLCEQLGVSRVSVRAAISRLSCMGILESQKGKGTFVCQESRYHPLDGMYSALTLHQTDRMTVFEFRKIIEAASAEYAAQRATTQMVDEMSTAARKMQEASDPEEILMHDLEFHHLIAEATANELIVRAFEILQEIYVHQFRENIAVLGADGAAGHQKIVAAIEIRDSERAKKAMLEHLDTTARKMAVARLNENESQA